MKILLIKPIKRSGYYQVVPNLGLGYLATSLRRDNHDVRILDCVKEKHNFDDFRRYLEEFKPDVAGIQLFTCDYTATKEMLRIIKNFNSKTITLIGGPHVSCAPGYTMKDMKDADFGFIGEAEDSILELLRADKSLNKIPGIVFRVDNEIKINPVQRVEDIDKFDLPAWDLMDPRTYPVAPHGSFAKQSPIAPIITSRGCPYHCTYCSVNLNTGRKFRRRSINNILNEILILYHEFGVREIHIEDDNFTLNKSFVKEFCERLIKMNLSITWACPNGVRLDTLDKETLQLMEKAGCYSFAIGIESGSPRILKDMRRSVTVETMIEKIRLIKETTNIRMTGFFLIGYPSETMEDIQMTLDLACGLPIDRAQFSNFLPFPGTEIFDRLVENGKINPDTLDFDKYLNNKIIYSPEGITPETLRKVMKRAFRRFYFRPKIMWRLLQEIHSPNQAIMIFRRILDIFV